MESQPKKIQVLRRLCDPGLLGRSILQQVLTAYLHPDKIAYSDFKKALAAGQIDEVAIGTTNLRAH